MGRLFELSTDILLGYNYPFVARARIKVQSLKGKKLEIRKKKLWTIDQIINFRLELDEKN